MIGGHRKARSFKDSSRGTPLFVEVEEMKRNSQRRLKRSSQGGRRKARKVWCPENQFQGRVCEQPVLLLIVYINGGLRADL